MIMKKTVLLFILIVYVSTFVFSGDDESKDQTDSIPPTPQTGIHVEITTDG